MKCNFSPIEQDDNYTLFLKKFKECIIKNQIMKFLHTKWERTQIYRTTAESNDKIGYHNFVNNLQDSSYYMYILQCHFVVRLG